MKYSFWVTFTEYICRSATGITSCKMVFHPAADVAIHPFGFTGKVKPKHSFIGVNIFITEGERLPPGTKIYV